MECIALEDMQAMPDAQSWASALIQDKRLLHVKNALDPKYVRSCVSYCQQLISHSVPNYHPLTYGAPNFYRVNFDDPRAHVKAFMHQVNFFEWNQDRLELFKEFGFLFNVRALTSPTPIDYTDTIRRISFQFYPAGRGHMNKHQDPVGKHQAGVLSMVLSKRGKHFNTGGFFVEAEDGQRLYPEDQCEIGDLVLFNGQLPHGVECIDEATEYLPLSDTGRWMALVAVTKSAESNAIADSTDLGER